MKFYQGQNKICNENNLKITKIGFILGPNFLLSDINACIKETNKK